MAQWSVDDTIGYNIQCAIKHWQAVSLLCKSDQQKIYGN